MKNLRVIAVIITMSCVVFAANYQDNNSLTHNINSSKITSQDTGYIDINDDTTLSKRTLEPNKTADKQRKKIYGDIETIGASVLMPSQGYGFNPTLSSGSVIQNFNYIKEDSNYQFNSASATFDFKQMIGTTLKDTYAKDKIDGSKVIFARLYWGGGISKGWNTTHNEQVLRNRYFDGIKDFNKITFATPKTNGSGMDYHRLTADQINTRWYGSYSRYGMQFTYQASVDVTDLVKASLGKTDAKRTFSAGDIKSTNERPTNFYGYRDNGWVGGLYAPHYGGWALTIVYDFENEGSLNGLKPKGVYVYDGLVILAPIHLRGASSRIDSLEIPFSGFFTPTSGVVNSSLTVLSFGAKKEVGKEDIEIKNSAGVYNSVFSPNYNQRENQFNSTITKFDKPMTSHKIYNNQMDLDVLNLAGHMSNRQTSTTIKLTAQAIQVPSGVFGERENIGLVAFSTELYEPEVCYIEKLLVRNKNKTEESDFAEVSTDANNKTIAKTGDTLRAQVIIRNKGHEDAEKLALSVVMDKKTASYTSNTTYIKPNTAISNNFNVTNSDKNADNTNLQRYSDGTLTAFIGRGAANGVGGIINDKNQALIQFDTVLGEEFKKDEYFVYNAKFINESINLEFDGRINKCDDKTYQLEIAGISNRIANKNFNNNGDSENLFTQLAGRPFDVKLLNFMTTTSTGRILENFDILPTEKIAIDIIPEGNCKLGTNVMTNQPFVFTKDDLNGEKIILINNILIDKAYSKLYFRISYLDENNQEIREPSCSSDPFSVRPKELRFFNSTDGTANFNGLVGGREYRNIWLQAVDLGGSLSQNYTTTVKPINFAISSKVPSTCPAANFAFLNATTLKTDFVNGKGELRIFQEGATPGSETTSNFVYPNVGHVLIQAVDTKWTSVDQDSNGNANPALNDCIPNSDTVTESGGKIGCDIKSANDLDLLFLPNDILLDNLQVLNFNSGAMTYMNNDINMSASANFNITARLGDAAGNAATLYTDGCYSRDVNLNIDLTGDIADITDATGQAILTPANRLTQGRTDVIYFDNAANADINKTDLTPANQNIGGYLVGARLFRNGVAPAQVQFNFGRSISIAKNPFIVTSNNFTFTGIADSDAVAGAPYAAPAIPTNAVFYYGRAYAPNYEGPMAGFNANVYYGVFCNGCNPAADPNRYPLVVGAQILPQTANWFVNAAHNQLFGTATALEPSGNGDYLHTLATTTVVGNITTPVIINGIEVIRLSSTTPSTDTISMWSSNWLLFNTVNPAATTNDFSVKFYANIMNWGGRAINEGGKESGVGSIVGGGDGDNADKFNNISNKTNERLNW